MAWKHTGLKDGKEDGVETGIRAQGQEWMVVPCTDMETREVRSWKSFGGDTRQVGSSGKDPG